jgi:hypothetical protein
MGGELALRRGGRSWWGGCKARSSRLIFATRGFIDLGWKLHVSLFVRIPGDVCGCAWILDTHICSVLFRLVSLPCKATTA